MDAGEFMLWVALITRIEPAEQKQQEEKMKANQPARRGR